MIFTNLIQTNLRTNLFGKQIEYYNRLESTNDEAWELIDSGEATHGMIVITDHQFKGKGRGQNSWFMSPSKGLTMSLILLDSITIESTGLASLAAGVAAAKTLENLGSSPNLKWPNDILFQQKKVGGILCESKLSGQQVQAIVLGLGLNINENKKDFPSELVDTATSLNIVTGNVHQRELVCAIFTTIFEQYWEKILQNSNKIIEDWTNYCSHINQNVSFMHNGNSLKGKFKKVNSKGHACIELDGNDHFFPNIILD